MRIGDTVYTSLRFPAQGTEIKLDLSGTVIHLGENKISVKNESISVKNESISVKNESISRCDIFVGENKISGHLGADWRVFLNTDEQLQPCTPKVRSPEERHANVIGLILGSCVV